MISIRKAKENDAKDIVYVNTKTWETTYRGILPDTLLDERKSSMDGRVSKTKDTINKKHNHFVAVDDGKIIGILSFGKSRLEKYGNSGEINSIYVLKEYQGIGIGKELFFKGLEELYTLGYESAILKVLDKNPAIEFYKHLGGVRVDEVTDDFGGTIITEHIIYFDNIKEIINNTKGPKAYA